MDRALWNLFSFTDRYVLIINYSFIIQYDGYLPVPSMSIFDNYHFIITRFKTIARPVIQPCLMSGVISDLLLIYHICVYVTWLVTTNCTTEITSILICKQCHHDIDCPPEDTDKLFKCKMFRSENIVVTVFLGGFLCQNCLCMLCV